MIPGAGVTLTSTETNVAHTTSTSESGAYSIPGLAPGIYSLTVDSAGFSKQTLNRVVLTSEQAQTQDVHLTLALQTAQTVTVNADEIPAVETATATISGTLSGAQIENLPTFSRDVFQAAILAPGTFGDNARSSSGGGATEFTGFSGSGRNQLDQRDFPDGKSSTDCRERDAE